MIWNEVTRINVKGKIVAIKDAMMMLSGDENAPEWPCITCSPGDYILEINVPVPFHAHRARIRDIRSEPELGSKLGTVDIDHGFAGFIDYESFLTVVKNDFESYEDWTMTELDDELAVNFSGEITFQGEKLVYVKSGDGDGTYSVFELVEGGKQVGIECIFVT